MILYIVSSLIMSSLSKLARKFIDNPESVSINDIERLVSILGYSRRKNASGERIYHKSGATPLNVPLVHGKKIKEFYVKRLTKILKLEDYIEEE
jgi:hypothetical protein